MHNHNKIFVSALLAAGLCLSPAFAPRANSQPNIPDSDTLNSIVKGNIPAEPVPQAQPAPQLKAPKKGAQTLSQMQLKQIENALKQNMQSAEFLMRAAEGAGATPKQLSKMEKLSVGFMKLFLTSITPDNGDNKKDESAPAKPKKHPARDRVNQGPRTSQGIIITAPDGSRWLVTPQKPEKSPAPRHAPKPAPQTPPAIQQPAPAPAQPAPSVVRPAPDQQLGQPEIIILEEEETVDDMPYWPTKEQLGKDGVLKYLEKRNKANN